MNKTILTLIGLIIVALVGGYFYMGSSYGSPTAGGTSNFDTLGVTGFQLGSGCNDGLGSCSGSLFTKKLKGTCTLATSGLPLAATSTATFTCAATGVVAGDSVSVNLASNPTAFGSFAVTGAIAATDSITVYIANFVGGSTSSFPLATTSAVWSAEI